MNFERTTAFLDSFLEMGIPGYDCIIYIDGQCVFRRFNGYADVEAGVKMNGKEFYNIYSCSKLITCVAALQLYERGLFQLDDELSRYMPEFSDMKVMTPEGVKEARNKIKISDLFQMTAGFTYNTQSPQLLKVKQDTEGRCPTREVMRYLAKEPLAFEPGTNWRYSLCHDVLAALVEEISGERFEDYVRKHIFEPLKMNDTDFLLPLEEIGKITNQYRFNDNAHMVEDIGKENHLRLGTEYASGGAGCVSTVDDYIKFMEAVRIGDIILKKETVEFMSKDRLNDMTRPNYMYGHLGYSYGLGVRCPIDGGSRTDFGWNGAAGAHLAIDPAHNMSIFYVQHVMNSPNRAIRNQVYDYAVKDIEAW